MYSWNKFFQENRSLESLRFKNRNEAGSIAYNGMHITYSDPVSCYYEIKDIFCNKIYHFSSAADAPAIIDAGGCIGISVLYFNKIYPNSRITVFEPDPAMCSLLSKNARKNSVSNLNIINAALCKHDGEVIFYPDGSDGGSIQCSDAKPVSIRVPGVRLSTYINGPVDMLKLNIEGMENVIIEELEPKLHFVKELIFEYHAFYDLPQTLGAILQILDRNKFRYLVTDATNAKIATPFAMPEKYRCFNLVYAKNTKFTQ